MRMEKTNSAKPANFWKQEGILYCQFEDIGQIEKWSAHTYQHFLRAIRDLCQGEPMPLIVDLRQARGTLSADTAKTLSARCRRIPLILGEAYLVQSLSVRLLVQSYVRLIHRDSTSTICTTLPAAKRFCESLVGAAIKRSGTYER